MSRPLSQAAFRALFAQQTEEVFLMCLKLEHASLLAPILLVHDNRPLVRPEGTYQPSVFHVDIPEESADKVPQVTLTIDNVDRAITDTIRLLNGRLKITMTVVLAGAQGEPGIVFSGASGQHVTTSTPATVHFAIPDDVTMIARIKPNSITGSTQRIVYRYPSFVWSLTSTGGLNLEWAPDGTTYNTAPSTTNLVAAGLVSGETFWVKVTARANNGSSQREIKHWWSRDGITWTQLGTTVNGAATSFPITSHVTTLGSDGGGTNNIFSGVLYQWEIHRGVTTPVLAGKLDAAKVAVNTAPVTSETGHVWTMNGTTRVRAVGAAPVEAGPWEFYLLSATYNAQVVQGVLGFEDDTLNVEFPAARYTPFNSPGLFA